jgi:hypothetical protein
MNADNQEGMEPPMKWLNLSLALGMTLTLGLAGCAFPGTAPAPASNSDAVTAASSLGGNRSLSITMLTPIEADYRTAAVVHRWVDNDIFQYEATLKVWNGTSYADLQTPLTVVVPRKGQAPKTRAVFTNLRQGFRYQVSIVARGNVGGTAATTILNANTSTATVFDFTAAQDVEDTITANVQIAFDAVSFTGTGTATVVAPAEGTYANPAAPETGVAQ